MESNWYKWDVIQRVSIPVAHNYFFESAAPAVSAAAHGHAVHVASISKIQFGCDWFVIVIL